MHYDTTAQNRFNRAFCRAAKKADVNDMAAIMAYVQELELLAQQGIQQVECGLPIINPHDLMQDLKAAGKI